MKLCVFYLCVFCLSSLSPTFSFAQNDDGSADLFNDIARVLSQLRGKTTSDQLKVFNFIRNHVNLIKNNNKQRSNTKFSQNFLPIKSFRKSETVDIVKTLGSFCDSALGVRGCPEKQGQSCENGKCECMKNYVKINSTHCLPGALLGFRCEDHAQCQMRVRSSSCIQGFCRCGAGFAPYRRANCLKGTKLDEKCRTDSQCRIVTQGSACKWIVRNVLGKCQCDARNPRRKDKCGPSGFALGAPCGRSFDCAQHVPGSICVGKSSNKSLKKDRPRKGNPTKSSHSRYTESKYPNSTLSGTCQCPKGYLDIRNGSRCVPVSKDAGVSPVSLGQQCLYDSQCKSADPYSTCKESVCTCITHSTSCSVENRGCFNNTFQCITNGQCVSAEFVCNGRRDCPDGSDELDCVPGRCSTMAFTCDDGSCVSRGRLCDGKPHCPDGSDEKRCVNVIDCPLSTFRCANGQCLPGYSFCNAKLDCRDGSDEDKMSCIGGKLRVDHCPFRCKNSRCRSAGVVCSGKDGCGDNSDEEKCAVCSCPKP